MHSNQLLDRPSTRFFDPNYCPGCRGALAGPGQSGTGTAVRCARCGLPLGTGEAIRLAGLLTDADRALTALWRQRQPPPIAPAPGQFTPGEFGPAEPAGLFDGGGYQPPAAVHPAHPAHPARRLPALGGAAILLGLGGLCLTIAALVFLSVSWTVLSLGAKVAVLAAVTGLLAAAAGAVTGRALRGSAETLWTITFADLALDLWAARRAHLLGLQQQSVTGYTAVAATALAVLALGCCLATRRSAIGRPLVGVQAVLAAAGFVAVSAAVTALVTADWLALTLATIALTALMLGARAGRLPVTERLWTIGAGLPWLGLVITGLVEVGFGRFVPQLWHGRAWELPAAVVLACAVAGVPAVLRFGWLRIGAAVAGLALALFGIGAVAEHYLALPYALAISTAVAATVSWHRWPIWRPAALSVLAGSLALDAVALAGAAAGGIVRSLTGNDRLWQHAAEHRLTGAPQLPVLALLVLLATTGLVLVARRQALAAGKPVLSWTLVLAGPLAAAIAVNAGPSVLIATVIWLAAATCSALPAGRSAQPGLLLIPAGTLAVGLVGALAADLSSLIGFGLGAVLTVVASRRWQQARTSGELTAIGLLGIAVAAGWHRLQPEHGAPAVAGLLAGAAVLAVAAASSSTRRWWCWLASTAVLGSVWIEAAAHQLHAPEPYSLPAGALALAGGWYAARHRPDFSSWLAFGPGLLVLTLPSLQLAVANPLSWRAALLGVATLALTLLAARYRLQAPLLIGASELALLAIREVGPYALVLPRWLSLGAIGLLLLGVGISWEDQLAHLRSAKRELAGMR